MAGNERSVHVVSDDEVTVHHPEGFEPPTIDSVGVLSKRIETQHADDFAKPAEEFAAPAGSSEAFSGVNAVFKRRVSNELKKFNRGEGGAESKRIDEKQFLSGYDAFDVVEPPYNQDYLAKIYELSAPHYAAVNAKVATIVGLGYMLTESNVTKRNLERMANDEKRTKNTRRRLAEHRDELYDAIESLNEEDSFTETLVKVWRDYEVTGNGYIEIGRKRDGSVGYVGHVPAQTIRIRRKRDGFVQVSGFEVQFFAHFGHANDRNPIGDDKPNEILHIKKYSPVSSYYGVPDIIAAMRAVAGNKAAEQFNLDYFENKAVPRHVIILKGAKLGHQAEKKLLSFFETALKGENHRSLYIPLPGDTPDNKVELKIEPVEAGIQDSSFNNYRKANLSDILMAHRVPLTKISVAESTSLAVARDADKTFKEQVAGPEQRILERKLDKIMNELSDAFDLKLNEMTLTDEDTQSKIDERRRKTGIETANEQRNRRGEPSIEGGDELFDMNGKSRPSTAEIAGTVNRERDSQRSASATDSAGEGRNTQGDGRSRDE